MEIIIKTILILWLISPILCFIFYQMYISEKKALSQLKEDYEECKRYYKKLTNTRIQKHH